MKKALLITLLMLIMLTSCSPKKAEHSFPLQAEGEYVAIYSQVSDGAAELVSAIEDELERFDENYGIPIKKQNITIYPTQKELDKAVGTKGYFKSDEKNGIFIAIPEDVSELNKIIKYICFDCMYYSLKDYSKSPEFINSGIAMYETYQIEVPDTAISAIKKGEVPTIKQLRKQSEAENMENSIYSFLFIDFIVEIYGYDRLVNYLSTGDLKDSFIKPEDELYDAWQEYLLEMYPTIDKIKETDHFVMLYAESDDNIIDDLAEKLEGNYDRLAEDIGAEPIKKTTIKIYPTFSAMKKRYTNMHPEYRSTWKTALGFVLVENEIEIVTPNDTKHAGQSYEQLLQVAVHELTHIFANTVNSNIPKYLNEGLAEYEAYEGDKSSAVINIGFAKNNSKGLKLPESLDELEEMGTYDQYSAVYSYGYTVVEYIISEYGFDGVRKMLISGGDPESLGETREEFYDNWIEFLDVNY